MRRGKKTCAPPCPFRYLLLKYNFFSTFPQPVCLDAWWVLALSHLKWWNATAVIAVPLLAVMGVRKHQICLAAGITCSIFSLEYVISCLSVPLSAFIVVLTDHIILYSLPPWYCPLGGKWSTKSPSNSVTQEFVSTYGRWIPLSQKRQCITLCHAPFLAASSTLTASPPLWRSSLLGLILHSCSQLV